MGIRNAAAFREAEMIVLHKGEKVTRESGEHVCDIARDLTGTPADGVPGVHWFTNWQIMAPNPGEPLPDDPVGSRWLRIVESGNVYLLDLHIGDGWQSDHWIARQRRMVERHEREKLGKRARRRRAGKGKANV
jgi:hypothetical protein